MVYIFSVARWNQTPVLETAGAQCKLKVINVIFREIQMSFYDYQIQVLSIFKDVLFCLFSGFPTLEVLCFPPLCYELIFFGYFKFRQKKLSNWTETTLKVSWFRNVFWCLQFSQKTNKNKSTWGTITQWDFYTVKPLTK